MLLKISQNSQENNYARVSCLYKVARLWRRCFDMKLAPVTKLKRNKTRSKTFDNDAMSANCDAIVIFPICGHLEQSESWISDV